MCAFLRPNGGDNLKNQLFDSRTVGEREQKLRAVLKNCTDGALDADEIDRIVDRVSLHRQYTIALYKDPVSFVQAIRMPNQECAIHIYLPAEGEFSCE